MREEGCGGPALMPAEVRCPCGWCWSLDDRSHLVPGVILLLSDAAAHKFVSTILAVLVVPIKAEEILF